VQKQERREGWQAHAARRGKRMTPQLYRIRLRWREWREEHARRKLHRSIAWREYIRRIDSSYTACRRAEIIAHAERIGRSLQRSKRRPV
jgi:hypothetical protein